MSLIFILKIFGKRVFEVKLLNVNSTYDKAEIKVTPLLCLLTSVTLCAQHCNVQIDVFGVNLTN